MTDVLTALQGDFKLFLQALWEQLDLPSPTRAQYAIADYLQSGPKRLQIQAFRGVGKSWITGAFVLWTLFKKSGEKNNDNFCIEGTSRQHEHLSTEANYRNTMAKASKT